MPTSQDVENESGGDVHLVASETSIEPKRSSAALPLIRIASADNVGLLARRTSSVVGPRVGDVGDGSSSPSSADDSVSVVSWL